MLFKIKVLLGVVHDKRVHCSSKVGSLWIGSLVGNLRYEMIIIAYTLPTLLRVNTVIEIDHGSWPHPLNHWLVFSCHSWVIPLVSSFVLTPLELFNDFRRCDNKNDLNNQQNFYLLAFQETHTNSRPWWV